MQLRSIFGCTEEDLRTVLEASAYIFEQAAYQGMAAEPLYEFLLEAGFEDPHAKVIIIFLSLSLLHLLRFRYAHTITQAFGRLWNSECHGFIAKLREKALVRTINHMNA